MRTVRRMRGMGRVRRVRRVIRHHLPVFATRQDEAEYVLVRGDINHFSATVLHLQASGIGLFRGLHRSSWQYGGRRLAGGQSGS